MKAKPALVGIVMGSQSDWATMLHAAKVLSAFNIPFEKTVVSAHRSPERLVAYAKSAEARGLRAIIAGAGGAAHLPGMIASMTHVPVCGVPVQTRALGGLDSLLSIVQMPAGVPVATFAIGEAGAANAAHFAARLLSASDAMLAKSLASFGSGERKRVEEMRKFEASQCLTQLRRLRGSSGIEEHENI